MLYKAKITFFFLFTLVLYISSQAQNYADKKHYLVDSLEYDILIVSEKKILDSSLATYHKATSDTQKLAAINFIIENSWGNKVWPHYNQWMYQYTSRKLKGLTDDFNEENISLAERELLIYYANSINNKGYFVDLIGDVKGALKYYYKALTIREQLNDSLGLSESYNNIGTVYGGQGDYEKALVYIDKTLMLLTDRNASAVTLMNKGVILEKLEKSTAALKCFNDALEISRELKNRVFIVNIQNHIGAIYLKDKRFEKSLACFIESETIANEVGYKSGYIHSLTKQAKIHFYKEDMLSAKLKANKAYGLAKDLGSPENIIEVSEILSEILKKENNWKQAFSMQELYFKMNDSVKNSEIEKDIIKHKATYDLNKKQKEIELLSAKNEIQELKLTKNRNFIIFISMALFLALITALVSFRGFKKKLYINKLLKRQKVEISRKNEAKKIMLQEIHHRVKNNLQVVNGLLRMQSSKVKDEKVVDMFKETQSRVLSMAKLHEKMYQSGDLKRLNAKNYITMLVEEIVQNYTVEKDIELDLDIEELFIDSETMMPLSLIINEIITNSLKYAFVGRKKGTISVRLSPSMDITNQLYIADDGIGYKKEESPTGLGAKLIQSFTRQLNGTIEKISGNGTAFKLTFENIIS